MSVEYIRNQKGWLHGNYFIMCIIEMITQTKISLPITDQTAQVIWIDTHLPLPPLQFYKLVHIYNVSLVLYKTRRVCNSPSHQKPINLDAAL